MLHPYLTPGHWTSDTYPMRDIHEKVAAAAGRAGLHVLDLATAYAAQGRDWRTWWATPYDAHPSAAGHALVATAVLDFVRQRGWLTGPVRAPSCVTRTRVDTALRAGTDGG